MREGNISSNEVVDGAKVMVPKLSRSISSRTIAGALTSSGFAVPSGYCFSMSAARNSVSKRFFSSAAFGASPWYETMTLSPTRTSATRVSGLATLV
ncbi:hypothetical protein D3C71_1486160 [compost metagenome]